mmetsp:Transcript_48697/g.128811  ORF Transcript_48697/g.128811 Transcript_48697/m.128811 type:complete len:138 (+) Transcript_48697:52-465(+)
MGKKDKKQQPAPQSEFGKLVKQLHAEATGGLRGVYVLELLSNKTRVGKWWLELTDDSAAYAEGDPPSSPSVAIQMDEKTFFKILRGEQGGMATFMTGKVKITGNLILAHKAVSHFEAKGGPALFKLGTSVLQTASKL